MANGLREWREETGLPEEHLAFCPGVVLIDPWMGTHYFVASWQLDARPGEATYWTPPNEDPTDPDPVVKAQWMPVGQAVKHHKLNAQRKGLLRLALQAVAREERAAPPAVGAGPPPALS